MFHRAPGSIGASAFPSRVLPGMKGAGHMGTDKVTVRSVKVVRVDAGNNLLVVRGSVPGAGGSIVVIRKG
jgi:large subunit ribosomal protein L3